MKKVPVQKLVARISALGLLIGVCAGPYLFIFNPIFATHQMLDESLVRTNELASRYEGIGADHEVIEAKIGKLLKRQTRSGIYLDGATNALAAAKLQQIAGARIKANRGKIRSIRALPEKTEQGFTRVSIGVQFQAPFNALQKIIHSFEANRPFVFVRDVEIKGTRRRGRAAKEQATEVPLLVRLRLVGYLRPNSG